MLPCQRWRHGPSRRSSFQCRRPLRAPATTGHRASLSGAQMAQHLASSRRRLLGARRSSVRSPGLLQRAGSARPRCVSSRPLPLRRPGPPRRLGRRRHRYRPRRSARGAWPRCRRCHGGHRDLAAAPVQRLTRPCRSAWGPAPPVLRAHAEAERKALLDQRAGCLACLERQGAKEDCAETLRLARAGGGSGGAAAAAAQPAALTPRQAHLELDGLVGGAQLLSNQ
mmetsp:Transcript_30793/g.84920  ORF Transcript_30793/g.84920 Transcript_30793/m.84920 type:complete len:225 (-) Transcript_30793:172-846(-)